MNRLFKAYAQMNQECEKGASSKFPLGFVRAMRAYDQSAFRALVIVY